MYLKIHPEKARSEADKETLDKIYKPGNSVKIIHDLDDDDEEEEEEGEGEEGGGEEEEEEVVVDLDGRRRYSGEMRPRGNAAILRMQPCPCCYPPDPNPYGYTCPNPIPPPPAPIDGDEYIAGIAGHMRCRSCGGIIPVKDGMACEICAHNWCGSLFECLEPQALQKFES